MKKQLFIFSQNVKKWITISHKSASRIFWHVRNFWTTKIFWWFRIFWCLRIFCVIFFEFQNFCVYQICFIAIGNSRTSRRNSIAKKLHKSKLKSLYTISPFIKVSKSSVHEPYLARKCFPFLQWQCPPLKQMHLSKQFFLTNLHIEVLLLSAKTTNGSIFVFYYTSFVG